MQKELPADYRDEYTLGPRVLGSTSFIIMISVVAFMALCFTAVIWQHFRQGSFLQHLKQVFNQLTLKQVMIAGGVLTILTSGTGMVLWKAHRGDDPLLKGPINHPQNLELQPIEPAVFKSNGVWKPCYIDKSSLDARGTGSAFLYPLKPPVEHYPVAMVVFLATPFYTAQTMIYHACRIIPVFLFTIGCLLIERFRRDPLFSGQRKFTPLDIVQQPAISLWHIVKAPFCGLAYLCAMVYSLAQPAKGRIWGAKIERDWNEGRCRAEGFWSVQGPQKLWRWCALGPEDLGQFNFFLAGCHQPIGVVKYQDGEIVPDSGKSLSEAVRKGGGKTYEVYSESALSTST